MKAEMEMATKLLEKDVHEKQDTIVTLRRQLDDIKAINLEMYNKLQVRQADAERWDIVLQIRDSIRRVHAASVRILVWRYTTN